MVDACRPPTLVPEGILRLCFAHSVHDSRIGCILRVCLEVQPLASLRVKRPMLAPWSHASALSSVRREVFGQATAATEPSEGSFDDPAPREDVPRRSSLTITMVQSPLLSQGVL